MSWLARLLGSRNSAGLKPQRRARVELPADLRTVYAIGDVHGRFDLLLRVEAAIARDAQAIDTVPHIVMLGDLIDRGPQSAQLLDHILSARRLLPRPLCLAGNHELAMCAFLAQPRADAHWLQEGGLETLQSYGFEPDRAGSGRGFANAVAAVIPDEHRAFLAALPLAASWGEYFLCHAGIDPARAIADQRDTDLVWFRDSMKSDYAAACQTVVHGHQVVTNAVISRRRINIDTGAYATGRLTAIRLQQSQPPHLISSYTVHDN